jgi:hypothetical protein
MGQLREELSGGTPDSSNIINMLNIKENEWNSVK